MLATLLPRQTIRLLTLAAVLLASGPVAETARLAANALAAPSAPDRHEAAHPHAVTPSTAEAAARLTELARQQRHAVAQSLAQQRPLAIEPLRQAREDALARLHSQAGHMSSSALAELQTLSADWAALDAELAQGRLSPASSFARHTRLLDRQLALQARLAG